MPRVSEVTQHNEDPILKPLFEAECSQYGGLLNPTRVLAHCPPILKAAKQFYASFPASGLVPASLHALVHVRVASINGCPF
ncbi:MAG: hypothetical protein WA888_12265 [Burkholderiaceae bacterium]